MATTNIEWTSTINPDGTISKGCTWNPTVGCSKVSQGCKNCYAEIMHNRLLGIKKMAHKYNRPFLDGAFPYEPDLKLPFRWKKPRKVFVDSMSDLFHKNISVDYIAKTYAVMFLNPHHTFQILTKRPERRLEIFSNPEFLILVCHYANQFHDLYIKKLEQHLYFDEEIKSLFPFKNIWEGTSVENVATKPRIDILRDTPAYVRFLSLEPLLEDLGHLNLAGIHQCITGGESGHNKRTIDADWMRNIQKQCKDQKVSFYMKQMDKKQPIPKDLMVREFPVAL